MFTGLIEELGRVFCIRATEKGTRLQISAPGIAANIQIGDSIAVNGCCLTVAARQRDQLTFDLLQETVSRTNLGALNGDSVVNLERALTANGRIGGHFVQGHIDSTGEIVSLSQSAGDQRLEVALNEKDRRYVAEKGSIAVNGISLTVAEIKPASFVCWIVPHTRKHTNLERGEPGDVVNLEFDILAKYVERLIPAASGESSLRTHS